MRQFIDDAVERYWGLVVTHRSSSPSFTGGLTTLEIAVSSSSLDLGLGTDESYQLIVLSEGTARLTAATVFGVVHGMETLSQLIQYDYLTGVYHIVNTPLLVTDKPRFAHRGILLDTSRHYHIVGMLKRILDSMSHAKLNVFHWHIVDIQSFPIHQQRFVLFSRSLLQNFGGGGVRGLKKMYPLLPNTIMYVPLFSK